jgi:hypothetical protein
MQVFVNEGVSAADIAAARLAWEKVATEQSPGWVPVGTVQGAGWTDETTTQDPGWVPVDTRQF